MGDDKGVAVRAVVSLCLHVGRVQDRPAGLEAHELAFRGPQEDVVGEQGARRGAGGDDAHVQPGGIGPTEMPSLM